MQQSFVGDMNMRTIKHWRTFRGRPNSAVGSSGMRVTIDPRGVIYLNSVAWEAFDKPKAVELMFDEGRDVIGLKATETWAENSFPVRDKSGTGGKIVRASPFLAHFSIKASKTFLVNKAHIDDDGILTLPLDGITVVTRGSR